MNIKEKIIADLASLKCRSAWDNGVKNYAIDLATDCDFSEISNCKLLKKALLNGASNWTEYSLGGCAKIYDQDIAEALCPPSELKRKKNGELPPNSCESWLDVQARALYQAEKLVVLAFIRNGGAK